MKKNLNPKVTEVKTLREFPVRHDDGTYGNMRVSLIEVDMLELPDGMIGSGLSLRFELDGKAFVSTGRDGRMLAKAILSSMPMPDALIDDITQEFYEKIDKRRKEHS